MYARQIDAFTVADSAAMRDDAPSRNAIRGKNAEFDRSIGNQDRIAGFNVPRQIGVGGVGNGSIALDRFGRNGERGAIFQQVRSLGKSSDADLGPLQIEQDADVRTQFLGNGANTANAARQIVLSTMGGVQAEDVNTGIEELSKYALRVSSRPESGNGTVWNFPPL